MSIVTESLTLITTTTLVPGQTSVSAWNYGGQTLIPISSTVASNSTSTATPSSQNTTGTDQLSSTSSQGTRPSTNPGNSTINAHTKQHSNGISSGAAAGIGIGCAIVGALLAALLVLLLSRNRSRSRPNQGRADGFSRGAYSDDGATRARTGLNAPMHEKAKDTSFLALLPLPMPEWEIGDHMSKLGSAVKNHAKSYYGGAQSLDVVDRKGNSSDYLARLLGEHSPVPANQLENLLSKPSSRIGAVRFLIAWVILRNIQPDTRLDTTILPPDLAQIMMGILAAEARNGGNDRQKLLGRWRQTSGALLQHRYGDGALKPNDSRQRNISEVAEMLKDALEPYATTRSDPERARNLEELVKRGARFGYLLFTQPSSWDFVWDQSGRRQGDWTVFPGLVQICDDQGRLREPPIRYAEPQVVQLSR